jgi:3-methylfumaryl-CoA hydratase
MTRMETFPEAARDWIGRGEERSGCLTPELAGMLDAAIAHGASDGRGLSPGADMPPLWHWAAFPSFTPHSELGRDGHPELGGFLPRLGYPRRMWAGGRLAFRGALRIGERLRRRSEIRDVTEKQGAAGPMAFVTVAHVIEGETSGAVEEEQDIVYLGIPDRFSPPRRVPPPEGPDFEEEVAVDETRLFRFSAATYNAHRIHYDLPYAREVEKYPGLVVHGPMQALMLIEAGMRRTGRAPARYRFRGLHPMFHDDGLRLTGRTDPAGGAIDLATVASAGHVGMDARMEWAR